MKTRYYGDFILDPNIHWVDSAKFSLNVLDEGFDVEYDADQQPEVISMWRQPLDHANKYTEWTVMRSGKWIDTVYFTREVDEEYVRTSLINDDNYPTDIIVFPVKKG